MKIPYATRIALFLGCALCCQLQANAQHLFYNQLPVPPLLHSGNVQLTMTQELHNFDPGAGNTNMDSVNTYAFNDVSNNPVNSFLGPTLEWLSHDTLNIRVTNNLGSTSSVHWHGAHVPSALDGGPHTTIPGGGFKDHNFDVKDHSCTLWYHPHPHANTFAQVNMGLAGIIIVRNDVFPVFEDSLPHEYNVDDFPLIIDSRKFNCTATGCAIDTTQGGSGAQGQKLTDLVNGVINPYITVPPQAVRFRILDASSRLCYKLGISSDTGRVANDTHFLSFNIIAGDAGYLEGTSAQVDSFFTAPGIRTEVIVDFTGKEGQTFYLRNLSSSFPNGVLKNVANKLGSLLEIRVGTTVTSGRRWLPAVFPTRPALPFANYTKRRTKKLMDITYNSALLLSKHMIDSAQFDMHTINDIVYLDSVEIWRIANISNLAHPFHIHDISFKVLSVETIDAVGNTTGSLPISPEYLGYKDDILVFKGQAVTFITKFEDFYTPVAAENSYMYHCHILTHEDGYMANGNGNNGGPSIDQRYPFGMMHQFVVTTPQLAAMANPQIKPNEIEIFPNPASDVLNLMGESSLPSKVRVFDLQGKTLMEKELRPFTGTAVIDVAHLESGMVLVEWQSAKGSSIKKIILQ